MSARVLSMRFLQVFLMDSIEEMWTVLCVSRGKILVRIQVQLV